MQLFVLFIDSNTCRVLLSIKSVRSCISLVIYMIFIYTPSSKLNLLFIIPCHNMQNIRGNLKKKAIFLEDGMRETEVFNEPNVVT